MRAPWSWLLAAAFSVLAVVVALTPAGVLFVVLPQAAALAVGAAVGAWLEARPMAPGSRRSLRAVAVVGAATAAVANAVFIWVWGVGFDAADAFAEQPGWVDPVMAVSMRLALWSFVVVCLAWTCAAYGASTRAGDGVRKRPAPV